MPRGGAHFSTGEVAEVLSHYDIGLIHKVSPLAAGNSRAPKMVIMSEQGKFLLKRRPKGKDDINRVTFAHAVQLHLINKELPVASLVTRRDQNDTVLQLENHVYEFFKFVNGIRYDGTAEATMDAGRQLAMFHRNLEDFSSQWKPAKGSFHDSTPVRRYLKAIGTEKTNHADRKLKTMIETLMSLYNSSSIHVNELGFDNWAEQIVHGDWHPGNMLFSNRKLVAILDFDSVKIAPPVTDLANGMLQFSIVGNRPNPVDWPDYLDQAKLVRFLNGYSEVIKPDKNKLDSLPDLMIETMIAEAVLPVAATGFFGNLSGMDFLGMIRRKVEWIDKNRGRLAEAIKG